MENAAFPKHLASGHLVFLTSGRLSAAPFDARAMSLTGSPVPIDEGLVERVTGVANFDVSPEGTFVSITGSSLPYMSRFVWMNRQGTVLGRVGGEDLPYPRYPRISPDGKRLVATVGPGAQGQLWTFDLAGAAQPVKLTRSDHNVWPVWLPDGKAVIFTRLATSTSAAGRRQEIQKLAADGSNLDPETVLSIIIPGATIGVVSPDGGSFLYSQVRTDTGSDLMLKRLGSDSEPQP